MMTGENDRRATTTSKRQRPDDYTKRQHKRPRSLDLRHNGRGILVTAGSATCTREALREALAVLKAEPVVGVSSSGLSLSDDVSERVDAELAELKLESERFIPVDSVTKGVSFIQFCCLNDQPNELIRQILERLSHPLVHTVKEVDVPQREEGQQTPTEHSDPDAESIHEGLTAVAEEGDEVDGKTADKEQCEEEEEEQRKKGILSCRFMNRLIPIELTCAPHPKNVRAAVKSLIRAYFPQSSLVLHPERFVEEDNKKEEDPITTQENEVQRGDVTSEGEGSVSKTTEEEPHTDVQSKRSTHGEEERATKEEQCGGMDSLPFQTVPFRVPVGASWCVHFERRAGMKTLDKDVVIEEVGRMVGGEQYKVNLGAPEYTVVIEVNNIFCGMSVVQGFSRLLKYNIHRLCHPEEEHQDSAGTKANGPKRSGSNRRGSGRNRRDSGTTTTVKD